MLFRNIWVFVVLNIFEISEVERFKEIVGFKISLFLWIDWYLKRSGVEVFVNYNKEFVVFKWNNSKVEVC